MNVLVVVNQKRDWPVPIPGASVLSAREYLVDPSSSESGSARVLNLCRVDRYQGRGYYVSLLAEARGHRPLPEAKAIGDFQAGDLRTCAGDAFLEQLQRSLAQHDEESFTVEAYFGRDPHGRDDAASQLLFTSLRVPLMRARFKRDGGRWRIDEVKTLSAGDVAAEHRDFLLQAIVDYVAGHRRPAREAMAQRKSLAILFNEDEPDPPSNPGALERFQSTASSLGMHSEIIGRDEIDRLPMFDALFIRDTTRINHYTYQFARRAASEGLVVIDDPDSILKCNNKVFLHELLARHRVPTPKTLLVHRENTEQIIPKLGLPCILKQPDSAFSRGVIRIGSAQELSPALDDLFRGSDLLIAQAWLPTLFDWRVGVFDRRLLYVCKYFMAPGHWQVIKREADRRVEGNTAALAVGEAPEHVVKTALRAANLIGDGLYGVDLKEDNGHCYVIEINDNPNLDEGNEDGVLQGALYREIMGVYLRRIRDRRRAAIR